MIQKPSAGQISETSRVRRRCWRGPIRWSN